MNQKMGAWLVPFRGFWSAHVDALERHVDRMDPAHLSEWTPFDADRNLDAAGR